MVKLEKIIDCKGVVLFDSCFIFSGLEGFKKLYESTNFHEIPREVLFNLERGLQESFDLFKYENLKTIREVDKEIKRVPEILGEKLSYFSFLNSRKSKDKKSRNRIKKRENIKERLEGLQQNAQHIWSLTRERRLNLFRDKSYNLMFEIIKELSKSMKLKKDTSFVCGYHEVDESYNSYTDEHLVCTAYQLSLSQKERPLLLSSDTDLIRLLGVIPRLMGSEDFLPFNEFFRKKITENCPYLYFKDKKVNGNELDLAVDGSRLYFDNSFKIRGLIKNKNRELKEKIRGLWERIYVGQ